MPERIEIKCRYCGGSGKRPQFYELYIKCNICHGTGKHMVINPRKDK